MSFISRTLISIGLVVIVAVSACLLYLYSHEKGMSFTTSHVAASSTVATSSMAVGFVDPYTVTTQLNGMTFEIATSSAGQEQGLGGRSSIPDNYAMLFVFPQDGAYGFWMKDMQTNIDMVWLSDNGTIVDITSDATVASYPNVFYPPVPIRYVLETRVGLANEKGWRVGTRIPLPLPYGA